MKVVKLISQIISILCLFLNFPNSMAAFPERPISMVVSFAPGGATDITARIVSTAMTKNMGQQIVVDNRPGVGGAVAAGVVKSAKANG